MAVTHALRARRVRPRLPSCGADMIFEQVGWFGNPPVTLRLVTDNRQVAPFFASIEHPSYPDGVFQMSEKSSTLPFSSGGTGWLMFGGSPSLSLVPVKISLRLILVPYRALQFGSDATFSHHVIWHGPLSTAQYCTRSSPVVAFFTTVTCCAKSSTLFSAVPFQCLSHCWRGKLSPSGAGSYGPRHPPSAGPTFVQGCAPGVPLVSSPLSCSGQISR